MMKKKKERDQLISALDEVYSIQNVGDGPDRIGYICNFKTSSVTVDELTEKQVLTIYFIEQSGQWCKSEVLYQPYFYVSCQRDYLDELKFYF
jgi:hypothetical protein